MIKVVKYLFSWENLPEKDGHKLRRFLKDSFDINWAATAKIIKTDDNTIRIHTDEKSVEIKIDKKEKKGLLKREDREDDLLVKEENGNFYIIDNRVSLGDIYRNVEYIETVSEKTIEEKNKEVGIVEIKKIIFPYVVIFTQDCDLAQDCKFRLNRKKSGDKILLSVLVAPIYNAEHVFEGEHLNQIRDRLMQPIKVKKGNKFTTTGKNLVANEIPRYHYLEFPKEIPIVPSIIDFKHYFSLNIEYLYNIREENFVCKISELYREDMSQRFASFLSRIGLP